MIHVWQLFHPELKAGRQAIEAGGAYVRAMLRLALLSWIRL